MFINEENYYRDLSGSYHPKTDVYKGAYFLATVSCCNEDGVALIESLLSVNAQVAHLLVSDERDTFFGMLDGLDAATSGGLNNG